MSRNPAHEILVALRQFEVRGSRTWMIGLKSGCPFFGGSPPEIGNIAFHQKLPHRPKRTPMTRITWLEVIEDKSKKHAGRLTRLASLHNWNSGGFRIFPVIVQQARRAYLRAMATALFRLLMLVALLLMPAGMAGAPALAQAAPAAAGHRGDHQKPTEAPCDRQAHCAVCAGLPALDYPEAPANPVVQAPRVLAGSPPYSDLQPEIATPPPKLS